MNIDEYNRDLRKGVRSRLALEHEFPASQSATSEGGRHKYITFQNQTGIPSGAITGTQIACLYVKTQNLFYANTAGDQVEIVDGTSLALSVNGMSEKTTVAADDIFMIEDSAGSWAKKKVKHTNIKKLGSWGGRSANTEYNEGVDGFVVGNTQRFKGNEQSVSVSIQTPTGTERCRVSSDKTAYFDGYMRYSFCCPVKKGDTWKAVVTGDVGVENLYWIPLGA